MKPIFHVFLSANWNAPELILAEKIKDYSGIGQWWLEKTIEDAYQKMKILQIKK